MPLSLEKVQREAPHLADSYRRVGLTLQKQAINPADYPAELIVEIDHSSSTNSYGLYQARQAVWSSDPTILQVADLAFVAALQFSRDTDPAMPASLFGGVIHDLGSIRLQNCKGFLNQHQRYQFCKTTNYRLALQDIRRRAGYGNLDLHPGWVTEPTSPAPAPPPKQGFWSRLFGGESPQTPQPLQQSARRRLAPYRVMASSAVPHLAIVITDGEPLDPQQGIIEELTLMSQLPIFVQFIGVGPSDFEFLRRLDNMEGRFVDNANFFHARDAGGDLDAMVRLMLGEFPDYYRKARKLGLIVP